MCMRTNVERCDGFAVAQKQEVGAPQAAVVGAENLLHLGGNDVGNMPTPSNNTVP